MERTTPSETSVADIWRTLSTYRWRILACVAAFVGLAICVAMVTPWTWRAHMTVWLVSQTIGREQQGEFGYDADRQLAVQLQNFRQVAFSDDVLAEVVERVPAPGILKLVTRDDAIDSLRERMDMRAPKGTEFGKSEIFRVSVVDHDPARALALAEALKQVSQKRYKELYLQKAESLTRQATEAADAARGALATVQKGLVRLEKEAGPDLHDLRMLAGTKSGDVLLKKVLLNVQSDRQKLEGEVRESQKRLDAVKRAMAKMTDANLTALPTQLLSKDEYLRPAHAHLLGLMAQVERLESRYTAQYPEVQAARRELADARRRFRQSLAAFVASLESDLSARLARLAYLAKQEQLHLARLQRLERMRTAYATAMAAVERALQRMQVTERRLAEAGELEARSRQAKLLLFVDPPKVDSQPVSPKRRDHVLAGLALGLLAGIGVAMLSRNASVLGPTEPGIDGGDAWPGGPVAPPDAMDPAWRA